ncbi:hypothetical protein F4805DRAFT_5882 [Annulohypoxylon moriforme]|nr:hypothetical protein F4805DRAFT_5882 [Annulohypoxylon moriforme]
MPNHRSLISSLLSLSSFSCSTEQSDACHRSDNDPGPVSRLGSSHERDNKSKVLHHLEVQHKHDTISHMTACHIGHPQFSLICSFVQGPAYLLNRLSLVPLASIIYFRISRNDPTEDGEGMRLSIF